MPRFASASLVLSLTLLLGRFAGFVREVELGVAFGVSRDADFAVVILTTPDLFVNLLLAGGLSVALIPEFGRLQGLARTKVFFSISMLVGASFGAIAAVIAVFPKLLIVAFAPGYADVPSSEYSSVFAITAFAIPLAGLTGITTALLNAEEKFFLAGAGTLLFNSVIIAALYFGTVPGNELSVLAVAVASAALLRYLSQLVVCVSYLSLEPNSQDPTRFRVLAIRFTQALGASTLVLFVPVMLRAIVSLIGAGNLSAYNFAAKLVELPLGIAITTISAVAFPALSKAGASGDLDGQHRIFESGLQRSLLLSLCIAIPCVYFSNDLVSVVFGRGRMTSADLRLVSDLAALGFLTLPFIAVSSMASALLNARGETGRLLKMTVAAALLVPMASLPGVALEDARISILALPFFHLTCALFLARSTRHPTFVGWQWIAKMLIQPIAASSAATGLSGALLSLIDTQSAHLGAAFAIGAIGLSIAFASAISRVTRTVWI